MTRHQQFQLRCYYVAGCMLSNMRNQLVIQCINRAPDIAEQMFWKYYLITNDQELLLRQLKTDDQDLVRQSRDLRTVVLGVHSSSTSSLQNRCAQECNACSSDSRSP